MHGLSKVGFKSCLICRIELMIRVALVVSKSQQDRNVPVLEFVYDCVDDQVVVLSRFLPFVVGREVACE